MATTTRPLSIEVTKSLGRDECQVKKAGKMWTFLSRGYMMVEELGEIHLKYVPKNSSLRIISMVVSVSPIKGGIGGSPSIPQLAGKIPLIYHL